MRAGIFLADGTGAGKTNEILGTILDNVLHGRAKNILVLAKRRHRHGFLEAWAKMGRDRRDFVFQWELKPGQAIRKQNAIVVTTYSTLRDYDGPTETYRSEEHTSELQSLMRISYADFRLKKKKNTYKQNTNQ